MPSFTPTSEWQFVPEDEAVPGGLEIRMDLEKGGRWARILQASDSDSAELASVPQPSSELQSLTDIDTIEEKAHEIDDGIRIAQSLSSTLFQKFSDSKDPQQDQAGRIISICLRNNNEATRAIISQCPDLPALLQLNKRSISILSAFVSTKEGFYFIKSHGTLEKLRRELGSYPDHVDDSITTALDKLLQDLVIAEEDGEDICDWVDALQQAYFTTKLESLKQLALNIVQHKGAYESLTVNCKSQPGLLAGHEEHKRAAESVQRYANPKAARNHFDEL